MCKLTNFYVTIITFLSLCVQGCQREQYVQRSISMSPTIENGEIIFVDKGAYKHNSPQRWDVVLLKPPEPYTNDGVLAFRVVGLPGETVTFRGNELLINGIIPGKPQALVGIEYVDKPQNTKAAIFEPLTLDAESYYVLGDNSSNANDSRMWGSVEKGKIIGKVLNK